MQELAKAANSGVQSEASPMTDAPNADGFVAVTALTIRHGSESVAAIAHPNASTKCVTIASVASGLMFLVRDSATNELIAAVTSSIDELVRTST
jgi:hypothetical protein